MASITPTVFYFLLSQLSRAHLVTSRCSSLLFCVRHRRKEYAASKFYFILPRYFPSKNKNRVTERLFHFSKINESDSIEFLTLAG